eukprot:GABU01007700.1.p1 GENE.GABU01007700.1~~GABU01007700.1.p1  ORF type:complete len:105 (-),score=16.81 GABU01007700.1:85-369(-)
MGTKMMKYLNLQKTRTVYLQQIQEQLHPQPLSSLFKSKSDNLSIGQILRSKSKMKIAERNIEPQQSLDSGHQQSSAANPDKPSGQGAGCRVLAA